MSMLSKGGKGYCIMCAEIIPQNIDDVFCVNCRSQYHYPINKGCYCHICGQKGLFSHFYPICMECKGLDREGLDAKSDIYRKWLAKYSLAPIDNLKPLWTCIPEKNDTIYNADIIKLIEVTNLGKSFDLNNIFKDDVRSNSRILNILERWNRKLYVDPPTIIRNNDSYIFKDGRHRTIAAYHLQIKTIPVFLKK